jgi:hypothetical protein
MSDKLQFVEAVNNSLSGRDDKLKFVGHKLRSMKVAAGGAG